jgi:hypothetical protein
VHGYSTGAIRLYTVGAPAHNPYIMGTAAGSRIAIGDAYSERRNRNA